MSHEVASPRRAVGLHANATVVTFCDRRRLLAGNVLATVQFVGRVRPGRSSGRTGDRDGTPRPLLPRFGHRSAVRALRGRPLAVAWAARVVSVAGSRAAGRSSTSHPCLLPTSASHIDASPTRRIARQGVVVASGLAAIEAVSIDMFRSLRLSRAVRC